MPYSRISRPLPHGLLQEGSTLEVGLRPLENLLQLQLSEDQLKGERWLQRYSALPCGALLVLCTPASLKALYQSSAGNE